MPRPDDAPDALKKQTQSLLEGMSSPVKLQIVPINKILMKTVYYFRNYSTHERQSHITKSQEKQLLTFILYFNGGLKYEEMSDIGIIRHRT